MCQMDETRSVDLSGNFYVTQKGWNIKTHQYGNINQKDLLMFYSNYLYWFGHENWRKILNAHIKQIHFKRRDYGYHGEFLLHLCYLTRRDVRPYYRTFTGTDFLNYEENIPQEVHEIIYDWGFREFHPVALLYQTGYFMDEVEFETAKPFRIPSRQPYKFDFVKFMKTREGCHDFEFHSIEGGEGHFENVGNGVYIYTPVDDVNFVDKFYVKYRDIYNGDITTCIVRVKQIFYGHPVYYFRLEQDMNMFDVYRYIIENITNANVQLGSGMSILDPGSSCTPWAAMAEGVFYPETTAPYKFIIIHDEDCLFYFSENQLTGDKETDAPYLYANLPSYSVNWNINQNTKYLNLTKGKRYYFRFIIKNVAGAGSGKVGYIYS